MYPPRIFTSVDAMVTHSHTCAQLLHNELIPEIPFVLKAKMAYQASKGMHFLHSSGTARPPSSASNLLRFRLRCEIRLTLCGGYGQASCIGI
jgi:hypothetical protein